MYNLCPFCGVEDGDHDEGVPFLHGDEVDTGRFAVVCGNCGGMGGIRDTPEEAMKAWNNRAIIQQQVQPDKSQKCTFPNNYIICGAYDGNGNCVSPKGTCRSIQR